MYYNRLLIFCQFSEICVSLMAFLYFSKPMFFIKSFAELMFQISTEEIDKSRNTSFCAVVTVFSKENGGSIIRCFTPFSVPFCENLCMRAMQFRGAIFKENTFIFYTVSFTPKADKFRYIPTQPQLLRTTCSGEEKR